MKFTSHISLVERQQSGFTLIELMVSITLGLLVVAAAFQLFISSYSAFGLQRGVADVQDSGSFGLEYVARDIRLANLNAPVATSTVMTDETPSSGVVLKIGSAAANLPIAVSPLSGNGVSGSAATKTITTSDQLVIQFLPQADGIDCEGTAYLRTENQYVIQQYFVRNDAQATADEPSSLALACRAGRLPNPVGAASIITWDNTTCTANCGQIVMTRVDYFHVLLGVFNPATPATPYRYVSPQDYNTLAAPRPQIQSIQIGVLARALGSVSGNSQIDPNRSFRVLDKTVQPTATVTSARYVRQVFTTTVSIRNSLG